MVKVICDRSMMAATVSRSAVSFFTNNLIHHCHTSHLLLPLPHLHYSSSSSCLHYPLINPHKSNPNPNPSPKPATITSHNKSRSNWRLGGTHQYVKSSSNDGSSRDVVVRSPSLVELEYADLNLKDMYGHSQVGPVRIRQHVNPLSSSFSKPVAAPEWKLVFEDCTLPLVVDIGSGSGRFLIWLAKYSSLHSCNYLGLEIRHKASLSFSHTHARTLFLNFFILPLSFCYSSLQLVQRSQFWVKDLGLHNIHFICANATVSFDQLVSTYPGHLTFVSILCPDPHFKKRHHKRRVLQKSLVDSISQHLKTGGQVFMQSDVLEVAIDMRRQFDLRSDVFKHIDTINHHTVCDSDGWLMHNPMGKRTEREIHAELEGAKIYRRMYEKRNSFVS